MGELGGCIDFCDQQSRPICVRRGIWGSWGGGGLLNARGVLIICENEVEMEYIYWNEVHKIFIASPTNKQHLKLH